MPAIQNLKKQLRSIHSTQKLTKAMKTISTVKFAKLNEIYGHYSEYGHECEKMFEHYGAIFSEILSESNPQAPVGVLVISANKGLCGSFNSELFKFFTEKTAKFNSPVIIACGKKAISYFKNKKTATQKEYVLDDVPDYGDCCKIFDDIIELRKNGKISRVYVVYQQYHNMLRQTPAICELFSSQQSSDSHTAEFVPDRQTVTYKIAKNMYRASMYEFFLEASIGAQAATLMTMRSGYDTATEYAEKLEREINRLRQSAVTDGVLITAENHD